MIMDASASSKRSRAASQSQSQSHDDDDDEELNKRARRVSAEHYLFQILDEEEEEEDAAASASASAPQEMDGGLASVMHSLEQEIRSSAGCHSDARPPQEPEQEIRSAQELGYLLEASDDELGLPPPAAEESPPAVGTDDTPPVEASTIYAHMWAFDDDIAFRSDFAFTPEPTGDVAFDDDVGLFDHSDPTWRTMPAT